MHKFDKNLERYLILLMEPMEGQEGCPLSTKLQGHLCQRHIWLWYSLMLKIT